jgi:hypothetical protein
MSADVDQHGTGGHATTLRNVLEKACSEQKCRLGDLTVLDVKADPYRVDTPAHHRDAAWVAQQIERFFPPNKRVHIRGLHYAMVISGNVRKPGGEVYRNTDEDWKWLVDDVMRAARWLGYVPFERIVDQRSAEPIIFRANDPIGALFRHLSAGVEMGQVAFEIGPIYINEPEGRLYGFDCKQPYALAIFGEKSSLEDVLLPIARRCAADLYLGPGEISNTFVYRIAKDASEDGRPLVVITATDFDPGGRQMPVSIGRKLQAFRDAFFPNLRFEVVPAALTVEQVRELGLPSTPLKPTEKRGDRWREEFGVEQTEIDALALFQPDVLRRIIETAIAPYFDRTLASRIGQARRLGVIRRKR